ncbi:MAG: DegT/DnrJ/EryC1/StrS family aminotransferase, partial [Acidobacteriota bacterium]
GRLCAVVIVHPFGFPARAEPFRARGLMVVEDCAQAIGAADGDRPVGSRGEIAIFSFSPTKIITCGGPGGALTSSQAALIHRARDLAIHDEREDARSRVNGLMGDLHAAIAGVQVGRLREFRTRRDVIAARYDEAFQSSRLERVTALPSTRPIVYRYIVRTSDAMSLIARLEERGITARRPVFSPLHRMVAASGTFPGTEEAHRELVSLPIYPALGDDEVETIIEEVRECLP